MDTIGGFFSTVLEFFVTWSHTLWNVWVDGWFRMLRNLFEAAILFFCYVMKWYFSISHDMMIVLMAKLPAYSGGLNFASDYLRVGFAITDMVFPLDTAMVCCSAVAGTWLVCFSLRLLLSIIPWPTAGG